MADTHTPKFRNDLGVEKIRINAREFECTGATPPHDHPHIFLDMGDEPSIVCPYCSTLYVYDATLVRNQADPAGSAYGPGEITNIASDRL